MPNPDGGAITLNGTARHLCWSCREETGQGPFCAHCVKIQPVERMGDYFALFGLSRRYALDGAALKEKFLELSRKFHPDFYAGKSEPERELARDNSAYLNAAFRTLTDPIKRAEYLLACQARGYRVNLVPPQELFEEILTAGELLESSALTDDEETTLRETGRTFAARQTERIESLGGLFDRLLHGDEAAKAEIEDALNEIKYLRTIGGRIAQRLGATI
jgi:molecular chaperone HscB